MFIRKGYVYRFLDEKNNVLYVGKTVDMDRRMKQHFSEESHLYQNGKGEIYNITYRIEYIECEDEYSALQKELYYINLYKPRYNVDAKTKQFIKPNGVNDRWKVYKVLRDVSTSQQKYNENRKIFTPIFAYSMFLMIILGFILKR